MGVCGGASGLPVLRVYSLCLQSWKSCDCDCTKRMISVNISLEDLQLLCCGSKNPPAPLAPPERLPQSGEKVSCELMNGLIEVTSWLAPTLSTHLTLYTGQQDHEHGNNEDFTLGIHCAFDYELSIAGSCFYTQNQVDSLSFSSISWHF